MAVSSSRTRKKSVRKNRFFPESVQSFIAKRIVELFGLAVLLMGVFVLLSLFTYTTSDPSLNTSVSDNVSSVSNLFGLPGAYFADLFAQSLGYASFALGLVIFLWGGRLLRKQSITAFGFRLVSLLIGTVLLSIALAPMSGALTLDNWSNAGGAIGKIIYDTILNLSQNYIGRFTDYFVVFTAGVLAAFALGYATHIQKDNWIRWGKNISIYTLMGILGVLKGLRVALGWITRNGLDVEAGQVEENKDAKSFSIKKWFETKFVSVKAELDKQRILKQEHEEEVRKKTEQKPLEVPKPQVTAGTRAQQAMMAEDNGQAHKRSFEIITPKTGHKSETASKPQQQSFVTNQDLIMPTMDLLQEPQKSEAAMSELELEAEAERLQEVLEDFGIKGDIVKVHPGPVVTLYELEPAPGTKSSRIISLSEDIARSMEAISVRAAVIPGKNAIGIEIPNKSRETVYLREILETKHYTQTKCRLPLVLGKDIGGHPVTADLAKMPHLLVAGTTGSGKSVAVNTMILSLIYHHSPEKCRFIMIDPKMLELSVYDGIPHLLSPVVTEPGKAVVALKWAVREMEERYRAMSKLGVRNIDGYNQRIKEAIKNQEVLTRKVQTGFDADSGKPVFEEQPIELVELPYIVVIVDEFADLMMVAGKDVEAAVQRLAQMARAAGIHLIMATQRPSVDVITGTVKANFPTRISFQVTSKIDSRTILGESGAEHLLGMGDMLYMASGGRVTRVHGPFASDDEVEDVVKFLKKQGKPNYVEEVTDENSGGDDILGLFSDSGSGGDDYDELYDEAVAIVAREQKASTSYLQRQLQIGYNRAARIIEQMEKDGVIGKANHVGKREILIGER